MEPIEFRQAVGARVRACREAQRLSQAKLAQMIGGASDGAYISRIEKGKVAVGVDGLYRIATALDVGVADLVDLDKDIDSIKPGSRR
ncbi:helix-turn-helix domain-containing protein [Arabiibacter massiliensis]|uniref:helix-turn-helix domain-containing protein n=1 Tax=Arabiibacter massiliensis TaxID=1870985 RepID=UPI0009BAB237|nr:helix-turn-helix transcriptional regulator [Arabiibacter massiliensis]